MKHFKSIFRSIFAALLIILTTSAKAQEPNDASWVDSVDISLLTCGPGQEVWSYYGHTALRIEDKAHGTDWAVNWGMFSFQQDYFILRFVFGLTDYQIGIFPMSQFMAEYAAEGRWVKQQTLALKREEKEKILRAISENNREENRTYRYNFFYDNCTTRARDMIINHLGAHDTDFKNVDTQSTYRQETHRWNKEHRWARFGNDLLLGYMADQPINKQEWEFLPINLMKDFDIEARKDTSVQPRSIADVYPQKATYIKLVDSTFYLIPPQTNVIASESITPRMVFALLGIIIIAWSGYEWKRQKNFWWLDAILLLLTGLPGLILFAMVFSQHPTVQINFQMLILNPLNLVFLYPVIQRLRKGKMHWYYNVWGTLLVIALFMQIWQDYAEGMEILALSLLVRYALRSISYDLKH